MSDWKSRATPVDTGTNDWKSRASSVSTPAEDPGLLQTILGKFANGGTLGFVDELAGGLEAAGTAAGIKGLGGPINEVGLTDEGPTLDPSTLLNAYRNRRDQERILQDRMSNAHPVVSGVSDVAGSLATIPMTGAATLGGRVASAVGMGALAGLGTSQADLTQGEVGGAAKDTAIGGALGGALQYGGETVLSPMASKVGNWIADSGPAKAIGKVVAGVRPDETERYLSRPSDVNNALPLEDIGQYFKDDVLGQFQQHVGNLDSKAWETLNSTPTINKTDVLELGDNFVKSILGGKIGNLSRTAGTGADADRIKTIYQQLDEIRNAYGDKLSEADLKSVVQSLQKLGWSLEGSPRTSIQGQALQQLSGVFNDVLKQSNPEYAQKMLPVQEATSTLQSLNRQFINQQAPEQMDKFLRTAKKFGTLSDESEAMKSIRGLDDATGAGIENMVKDRLALDSFDKSDTNGSRKTLAGAILGKSAEAALGGAIGYGVGDHSTTGAAVGAMAGLSMDKYAGQIFKSVLNGQIAATAGMSKIAPFMGEFAGPLIDAANRGSASLAATHFLLQQNSPAYRQKLEKLNEDQGHWHGQ